MALCVAAVIQLLWAAPALLAQDTPPPAVEPAAPAPAPAQDPAPAPGETPPPAEAQPPEEPAPEEEQPAMDHGPPPVDPSAPLQRFRRGMRGPSVDEERASGADSVSPPAESATPVTDVSEGPRKGVQLRLKNGETVVGEVVSETPEGWAIKLPTGETRFYDRLDVVSDNVPKAARPSWMLKSLLGASVLWPGAGQLLYGAVVQKGQPWERSALVVGAILAAVTVGGLMVLGVGLVAGFALPAVPIAGRVVIGGPFNPITLAGLVAVVLAMAVGLLDAGARAILD